MNRFVVSAFDMSLSAHLIRFCDSKSAFTLSRPRGNFFLGIGVLSKPDDAEFFGRHRPMLMPMPMNQSRFIYLVLLALSLSS